MLNIAWLFLSCKHYMHISGTYEDFYMVYFFSRWKSLLRKRRFLLHLVVVVGAVVEGVVRVLLVHHNQQRNRKRNLHLQKLLPQRPPAQNLLLRNLLPRNLQTAQPQNLHRLSRVRNLLVAHLRWGKRDPFTIVEKLWLTFHFGYLIDLFYNDVKCGKICVTVNMIGSTFFQSQSYFL